MPRCGDVVIFVTTAERQIKPIALTLCMHAGVTKNTHLTVMDKKICCPGDVLFHCICTHTRLSRVLLQFQEKVDALEVLGADVRQVPAVPFDNPKNYNHQVS